MHTQQADHQQSHQQLSGYDRSEEAIASTSRTFERYLNKSEQMRERIPPSTGFQQWSSKGDCPSTMVQERVEMNASTMETRDREDFEERVRDFKP